MPFSALSKKTDQRVLISEENFIELMNQSYV
jgi:hypothetical protein